MLLPRVLRFVVLFALLGQDLELGGLDCGLELFSLSGIPLSTLGLKNEYLILVELIIFVVGRNPGFIVALFIADFSFGFHLLLGQSGRTSPMDARFRRGSFGGDGRGRRRVLFRLV